MSSGIRKLLYWAEAVCESDEVIARAIFNDDAYKGNPAKLKEEGKPSLRCFTPRLNKEKNGYENLSVIHEDKRDLAAISTLAQTINPTRSLKGLAKVLILHIERLKSVNLKLDVIRDDNPFEGHTEIMPIPSDEDEVLRIANQLRRVFRESGELQIVPPMTDAA